MRRSLTGVKLKAISLVLLAVGAGCAGVKNGGAAGAAGQPGTGVAGLGGAGAPAPGQLAGLVALTVAPPTQTLTFQTGTTAQATFTAVPVGVRLTPTVRLIASVPVDFPENRVSK